MLLKASTHFIKQKVSSLEKEEKRIISETVKERFGQFLLFPLTTAVIGANHFAEVDFQSADYGFLKDFINSTPEILGLNILNQEGVIVRGYPLPRNAPAVGKKSQNYSRLMESMRNKETYWLSPPFDLFQNRRGFIFYVPIIRRGQHRGWFATVLSAQEFIERFRLSELLSSYHLIIRDRETGLAYFSSLSDLKTFAEERLTSKIFYNRDIEFLLWRQQPFLPFKPDSRVLFLLSVLFSILLLKLQQVAEHRKKAATQLEDVRNILKLTSSEALSYVVDLSCQLHAVSDGDANAKSRQNLQYLVNLLEQVNLLQTAAQGEEELREIEVNFCAILARTLEELAVLIEKRGIKVSLKLPQDQQQISVRCNEWLLKYSVLYNLLSHAIIHAETDSEIRISCETDSKTKIVTFHVLKVIAQGPVASAIGIDRRLEVARQLLKLYGALLHLHFDLNEGLILRISFPASEN